jgi:ABC-type uncharacterized transport system ATPase subunit
MQEAEPADRVVLLSRGKVVACGAPTALEAEIGKQVAEFEGAGAERLAEALSGLEAARTRVRTERGYRIGLTGARGAIVELAGTAPGIDRFVLRRPTLEDVYFARTQEAVG